MLADDAYILAAAERLRIAGHWDSALQVLGDRDTAAAVRIRAETLTERFWWRHIGCSEAEDAADALATHDEAFADFLRGQISYTRILFDLSPRPDDPARAEHGFTGDGGWQLFWSGVLADNVHRDQAVAAARYAAAAEVAAEDLLRSYVVRHQAGHLLDGGDHEAAVEGFRTSLALRIGVGAAPQVAGAAATLAEVATGAESERWRGVAVTIARDLRLDPLLASITG
ncbi:MAG TPA: hypothetical protein VGF84_04235 [Micromonosporaceae bacterium]|jgi:hypothetical protein